MKSSLLLSILLFNTTLFSSNTPQSLNGLIEVSHKGNSTFVFLYNENSIYGYLDIDRENFEEAVMYTDTSNYNWDSQDAIMTSEAWSEAYYTYQFFKSPSPYFFPFRSDFYYNSELDPYNSNCIGLFYDARLDLDKNGVADGEQLASGSPYSFDETLFNNDLLLNIIFASPGEFLSSYLPLELDSENIEHYTIKTLKSEDLENWDTVLTKTVKGTANNLFFKSEITPTE
ncbi:MAG: hypothetical protein ACJZ9L_06250 [Coraliomargaritaceae bacterium]